MNIGLCRYFLLDRHNNSHDKKGMLMNPSVKVLLIKLFTLTLILPLIMMFNYITDPLQFYRKATYFNPQLNANERYQTPGFAKNFDYDTVIVGTSLTENFFPSNVNKTLGVKSIKLSISGSLLTEQQMILNVALRTKKVKNVLWGIDFASYACVPGKVRDTSKPFPYYLYDDNFFNDYFYLLSPNTTEDSLKTLIRTFSQKKSDESEALEYYGNWNYQYKYSKNNAISGYFNLLINNCFYNETSNFDWTNIQTNLKDRLVKTIEQNPHVNFYLFFTPCSILAHKYYLEKGKDVFGNQLKARKLIVSSCDRYSNCKLFDFQTVEEIVTNYDNYRDQTHYSQDVNYKLIDFIKSDYNRITKDNVDDYNLRLEKLVMSL